MFKNLVLVSALLLLLSAINISGAENGAEVNLNAMVITASLKPLALVNSGTNITVIGSNQLKEADTQDIGQILNRVAGLNIPRPASLGNAESLSIRGVPSQQVLVLLDGCPLNSPSLGLTDLSQIPKENIARIEVIRGAASALYGANAMGGVVNIITRRPMEKTPESNIDVYIGSFNTKTYSFSYAAKPGKLDYLLSAGRSYSNGWRKNNDYDNNTLGVRLGYDFDKAGRLTFNEEYYRGQLGTPGPSNIPLDQWDNAKEREAASPNSRQVDHNNLLSLAYDVNISPDSAMLVKAYYRQANQGYLNTDFSIDDSYRTYTDGINSRVTLTPNLTAGYEYRLDKLAQRNNDAQIDVINESVSLNSLYAEYTGQLDQLILSLGARYDHHSISGGQFDPRFGLTYNISSAWKASGNIARGFRPPTLNDLFWPRQEESFFGTTYITQGNRNLKPEKAVSYDAGAEYNHGNAFSGKLTIFYISSVDLIAWQSDMLTLTTYRTMPQNFSQARNLGAELELEQHLTQTLSHHLNYTASQATGKKEIDPDYLLLAFHPKHKLNYTLDYSPRNTVKISITDQWISKSFEQNSEKGTKIPSANIWKATLTKKVNSATMFFTIDNIFNQRYANRTDGFGNFFPLPGRTYWFGINLFFVDR